MRRALSDARVEEMMLIVSSPAAKATMERGGG
jgi:hypothetical protein